MKTRKFNLNSILLRLFLSFLVVITPIMVAGIVMFTWERHTIKTEIENSASANVQFLQSTLESEIQNIKMLQYNLVDDTSLKKLITEYKYVPVYEYYTLISNVQQRLLIMKNSNAYIQDVILYVPGINQTVSSQNGYTDFNRTEYNKLLDGYINTKYPLIISDSNIYTVMLYPVRESTNAGKSPSYLVAIQLSKDKIKKLLVKLSKYNESDTALYDYTAKNWLYAPYSRLEGSNDAKLDIITGASGRNLGTDVTINNKKYYIVSGFSQYLNYAFVEYVDMGELFRIPDSYGYFLWVYAALSIVIMLVYSFSTYRFVKYPIKIILKSFKRLEEGDLSVKISLKAANEFNYLFEGFNKMMLRLNELIDRVYKQEIYAKKSELKQLQSQINPHFLYNSFFLLHRMIKERDIENAQELASHLGKYFRFITRNAPDEVTMINEIDHARSYVQIQEMRFNDRLSIEFGELPEEYRNFMVPRMILQPILENSIEHGLKSKLEDGRIRITFTDNGSGIIIVIEDNGEDLSDSDIDAIQQKLGHMDDSAETTGILNVHRRIELRYNKGSGISVSRSILGGLMVTMKIIAD